MDCLILFAEKLVSRCYRSKHVSCCLSSSLYCSSSTGRNISTDTYYDSGKTNASQTNWCHTKVVNRCNAGLSWFFQSAQQASVLVARVSSGTSCCHRACNAVVATFECVLQGGIGVEMFASRRGASASVPLFADGWEDVCKATLVRVRSQESGEDATSTTVRARTRQPAACTARTQAANTGTTSAARPGDVNV